MPVSRDSCTALTAFFPVRRSTIFCLKATEYGLVMLGRLAYFKKLIINLRGDNYPDTGGRRHR
jgi:hypothetical protein